MQNEVVGYCVNSGSRGFANSTQYGTSPHSINTIALTRSFIEAHNWFRIDGVALSN